MQCPSQLLTITCKNMKIIETNITHIKTSYYKISIPKMLICFVNKLTPTVLRANYYFNRFSCFFSCAFFYRGEITLYTLSYVLHFWLYIMKSSFLISTENHLKI